MSRVFSPDTRYLSQFLKFSTWPAFARISNFHPSFSFPFPLPLTAVQMGMKPLHRSCSASLSFSSSSCLPNIAKTATENLLPLAHNLNLKANIVEWQCCSCLLIALNHRVSSFPSDAQAKETCAHSRPWRPPLNASITTITRATVRRLFRALGKNLPLSHSLFLCMTQTKTFDQWPVCPRRSYPSISNVWGLIILPLYPLVIYTHI